MNRHATPPSAVPSVAPPSKTRRKLEMQALQDLGASLVTLDPKRLATLALPERLVDAIALARSVTQHEARRRQMQYIGRLMRDVDAEPIRAALAAWAQGAQRERAQFAHVERWRDRVLHDADGAQAFVAAYPAARLAALTALADEARAERARQGPPHKARALFRELKRIVEAAEAPLSISSPEQPS
jgi:ribosome-associated protein